jgi:hypothetical protein
MGRPSLVPGGRAAFGKGWDIVLSPLWVAISQKFAGILEASDCFRIGIKGAIYRQSSPNSLLTYIFVP